MGEAAERFGAARLVAALEGAAGEDAARLVARVKDALEAFTMGDPSDDVAVLTARLR